MAKWFEDNVIPVLKWPPYSPDLNPIKMVSILLKQWVIKNGPELLSIGNSDKAYQAFYNALRELWQAIP
jgi:hypothetical protein